MISATFSINETKLAFKPKKCDICFNGKIYASGNLSLNEFQDGFTSPLLI